MRVIGQKPLREFWEANSDAKTPLRAWFKVALYASWQSLADVREIYPTADGVTIDCPCGRKVIATVFNMGGNKYRLITLINYRFQVIFVKPVLTHKEYDKGKWRKRLCPKQ